ncbi:MAG: hypothetical protein K6E58_03925 [Eubacterium sp.]|nr:hypothetical protein [Eubacterium sp.]
MAKRNRRVIPIKGRMHLNVGIVVLGVGVLYLLIFWILMSTTTKTKFYEVSPGSNAENNSKIYSGIALRKESTAKAKSTGYIEFFVRDGLRVSKSTTLYSIDSSGKLTDYITKNNKNSKLSSENVSSLTDLINDYSSDYDDMSFNDVYEFKSSLKGSVIDLINTKTLKNIAKKTGTTYSINKSKYSGIVSYQFDGFENLKPKDLKEDDFTKASRRITTIKTGDQMAEGEKIYKVITNDEWSIAIQLDDEDIEKYKDTKGVHIKFVNENLDTTANFEIVKGKDNKNYGIISLSKYAIRFANDRYVNIQIINDVEDGLKIPKTSLVKKSVYIVPKDFGSPGGNSDEIAFNVKKSNGKNKIVYPPIAYSDSKNYYVSMSSFDKGDVLVMPNSSETYTIGHTKSFNGVYNINNGYTKFVRVKILNSTDEYYIIKAGDVFSISIYDRIVLNADSVKENQIISQ